MPGGLLLILGGLPTPARLPLIPGGLGLVVHKHHISQVNERHVEK